MTKPLAKLVLLVLLLSGCATRHHGVHVVGYVSDTRESGATTPPEENGYASGVERAEEGADYHPTSGEHLAGTHGQESSASHAGKAVPSGTKVVLLRVVLGIAIMYAVACGIFAC